MLTLLLGIRVGAIKSLLLTFPKSNSFTIFREFTKMNFKLKGEFKGVGSKRIEIMPGEEVIFLTRVRN